MFPALVPKPTFNLAGAEKGGEAPGALRTHSISSSQQPFFFFFCHFNVCVCVYVCVHAVLSH